MRHAIATATVAGQDRAAVFERGTQLVVVLADGAGGSGGAADAATGVVDAVCDATHDDWCELLLELDGDPARLGFGQTTAVVLTIDDGEIRGASVGDSAAWILRDGAVEELTQGQQRKPLLGAGASPWPFGNRLAGGSLVVASDGLWSYASRAAIANIASGPDVDLVARQLVELVRLPSGEYPDDVTVIVVR